MITEQERVDRKLGIGGSDIPIIMGFSSYKTPYQLWCEKTGLIQELYEETPVQYWGNKLEPIIRDEFSLRNNVVIETPSAVTHPFHEFMRGNVDGYIPEWNAVFEAKSSMQFMSREWGESGSDVIPMSYILQVAYYCSLLNADCAHIAVLIGGNDYREFKYTRDNELEATIIKAAKEFWGHVKTGIAPPSIDARDLKLQFPSHKESKSIEANDAIKEEIRRLQDVKLQLKDLQLKEEKCKFEIMNHMQDAECLVDKNGIPLATFKANKKGARALLMKCKD